MPQILMTHPDHGCKFALSETEVAHDEKLGWTRYTDGTPEVAAPVEKRKYTRRVTTQTLEQPNDEQSASDESAGE